MSERPIEDDSAWDDVREQWQLRADTTYLNHGSFGPPPEPVRAARRRWIDQLDDQPMDFFVRKLMPALRSARAGLAAFVGSQPANLVFVENATSGMNVIADSFPLRCQDEVLLTDHEYGAVARVWERACRRADAAPPTVAQLPMPVESPQQIVDKIFEAASDRTRLIVVSHITSATAIILPVQEISRRARELGIEVCIDGPHAPVQVPLDIESLKCDYYTASCHKWLCAPFGSGFLYVAPERHHQMQPQQLSWGTVPPEEPACWDDEFFWRGTRDPSAFLSTSAAVQFIQEVGVQSFRDRTHHLARHARQLLLQLPGTSAITPDETEWYGSMSLVRLPDGDNISLQRALWEQHQIEVPIVEFGGARYIRVSCHLYNRHEDVELLVGALRTELR